MIPLLPHVDRLPYKLAMLNGHWGIVISEKIKTARNSRLLKKVGMLGTLPVFIYIYIYIYTVYIFMGLIHSRVVNRPKLSRMSRISHFIDSRLTDGSEVVRSTLRLRFTPQKYFLVAISVRGWVNFRVRMRLEGLSKLETNSMISSELEPDTLRTATQYLKPLRYCFPVCHHSYCQINLMYSVKNLLFNLNCGWVYPVSQIKTQ
jgi:hypothetical protein